MSENVELKPCPFCGGPGYLCQIPSASGGERYIWVAKCSAEDGCGVEFLGCSRKIDAIREWNKRVALNNADADKRRIVVLRDAIKAAVFAINNHPKHVGESEPCEICKLCDDLWQALEDASKQIEEESK